MVRLAVGLVRGDEGRADLHARSAKREGGSDPAPVGDAARGDHRHIDRVHHLRQKREETHLRVILQLKEQPPVSAGFPALGDYRIDAPRHQPAGLGHGGGRTQDLAALVLERRDGGVLGQAEVKADHRRGPFQKAIQLRRAERQERGVGIPSGRVARAAS